MTETNIRIVEGGTNLQVVVRSLKVSGQDLTPDLMNKACDRLRKRRGLAAVPLPGENVILVATNKPVNPLKIEKSDWYLEAEDTGQPQLLCFKNSSHAPILAKLFERGMMSRLEGDTKRWTIKRFPRTFYDQTPCEENWDIAAYRRYEVSCEVIEGVGIGIAVEVGTAFISKKSVADYFRDDLSVEEQDKLQRRFYQLRDRRKGKKGTLLYNNKRTNTICYYDSFPRGVTSGTTGKIRVENETYQSLTDYYKRKHGVTIRDDEPVAKVSFKNTNGNSASNGLSKPVFVCAKMVRLRVMNDHLPRKLKQVDKLTPMRRDSLISQLWKGLAYEPLGNGFPKVSREFWRPAPEKTFLVTPPNLLLGDGEEIDAPINASILDYRNFYRRRVGLLDQFGCYDVPPTVSRVLHVAAPNGVEEETLITLAEAITGRLSRWTRKTINWNPIRYSSLDDAFTKLKRADDPGLVLFAFDSGSDEEDDTPETYYMVAHEMKDWRVKRLTVQTLLQKAREISTGYETDEEFGRNGRDWDSFIEMNALDVLQQMDCVPWSLKNGLYYPAHLGIDVGEGRKHFGVSLLICQPETGTPKFFIKPLIFDKPDDKKEEINSRLLEMAILTICKQAVDKHSNFTPLPSLLTLRDGRECGGELPTILGVREKLVEMGFLSDAGFIAPVDVHKKTAKGLRVWDRNERDGRLRNTLEGRAVLIDPRTVILNNTGAATLTQGTAEPVILRAQHECVNIKEAAIDFHQTAQFNYSSPGVAQRLALVLKRLDDDLKSRAAQVSRYFK